MPTHYRKTRKLYVKRKNASAECPFCDSAKYDDAVYSDTYIFVIPNQTKHDVWELHDVDEHLLVMPKRHVRSYKELSDKERLAIINFIADYESCGYNVYARGVGFSKRSVEHQHTHLIKADNTPAKFSLYIQKPYLLIKR